MTDLEIRLRALELAVQADNHNATKLAEQFYAFLTTREKVAPYKQHETYTLTSPPSETVVFGSY